MFSYLRLGGKFNPCYVGVVEVLLSQHLREGSPNILPWLECPASMPLGSEPGTLKAVVRAPTCFLKVQ